MARRYYRKRRKSNQTGVLLIVGIIVVAALYNQLSSDQVRSILTVGLGVALVVVSAVIFIAYKRKQWQKQKLRALNLIDADYMDGLAFEKYVAELLRSQGYSKVTLTERYDLGIDVIAVKDGIRWGIQVKRHSNMVKAEAVRQVVTALKKYDCQRSMVVTNSNFSRPARVLAESNDCVLIGKDELAKWIIAFQEGS